MLKNEKLSFEGCNNLNNNKCTAETLCVMNNNVCTYVCDVDEKKTCKKHTFKKKKIYKFVASCYSPLYIYIYMIWVIVSVILYRIMS